MEQKRCISSFTLAELTAELKAMGQPGFRAKQIFHWVHQKLVTEFSAMIHAGGLPHGLPLLRVHPGGPRARSGSRRDLL